MSRRIAAVVFVILLVLSASDYTIPQPANAAGTWTVSEYPAWITAYSKRSNSVVLHPASGKIYASMPSSDRDGNAIARIDPGTGAIERRQWIGSEPKKLALAADGRTIYVGLDGAFSIRKYDAPADAPGDQFPAGLSPLYGPMPYYDFALSPVDPNVVAISRNTFPEHVAVFDGGMQRPNVGGSGRTLSFANSESTLYGIDSNPIRRMSIDAMGITSVAFFPFSYPTGNVFQFHQDRFYTSAGRIFRASDLALMGSFSFGDFSTPEAPFVIDAAANKIIYVGRNSYCLRIEAFDLQTFQPLGWAQFDLGTNENDPKSVAKWGTNGLAVSMSKGPTLFIQSELIGPGTILPPAQAPAPISTPAPAAYIRRLNIPNNDLLFNRRDQLLYASVPNNAAAPIANTITRIDPDTGAIVSSAIIGDDPHKIALSDDGETLYAALHGAYRVRRFDTVTQTPGLIFEIPNRFQQPLSFAFLPGSPDLIVVSFGPAGAYVYDNGVARPQPLEPQGGVGDLFYSGTPNVLYAGMAGGLAKLQVSPVGLSVISQIAQTELSKIAIVDGKIYSSNRRVVDLVTYLVLGSFDENEANLVVVDAATGRAFFAGEKSIEVFDIHTYNKIGSIALPDNDEYTNVPTSVVRWGHNGLAIGSPRFIGDSSILLVRSHLIGATRPFDFDADGKSDLAIFRRDAGEWWINRSSDGATSAAQFSARQAVIVPADYTGDGKTDIAVWRPSSGEWHVLRSEDNSYDAVAFGTEDDVPSPADFDGDGRADLAVFRPSSGTWFIQRSGDNETTIEQFGTSGDLPVPADYDGDGKSDIAIYRPSNGQWWLDRSTAGLIVYQFGNSDDRTVQGDYTGDGKSDVALWRPSTGEWLALRSEDSSYYSLPFGISTDLPATGDYDGDGKFDPTVFRPSSATWYSQRTSAGILTRQFGAQGDQPVGSAFVR
jgi:DNA-binding beta-propeller fold protein YncE